MEAFRIGGTASSHVLVSVSGRERPESTDYWDGNWLVATVEIAAGAFRGEFAAQLRTDEFTRFRTELRALYGTLIGRATFRPMEPSLTVDIEGDGKGHLRARCDADDNPGIGNRLTFVIDFDQTDVPPILLQLDAVCEAFPVIGKP